jgi:uncharacterized protein (DUF1015 family)
VSDHPIIRPFHGLIVRPDRAAEVVTPPYETLTPERWHSLARERPDSFHHVVAAEPGDPGTPTREEGLERGAQRLREMLAEGTFAPTDGDAVVVHRIRSDDRDHTGLIVHVPVDAYVEGRVLPHEAVRDEKAERFTAHLRTVRAASTPALITHRGSDRLDRLARRISHGADPLIAVAAPDGSHHRVWVSRDPEHIMELAEGGEELGNLYVADGHHRIAAAARVAAERGRGGRSILGLLIPPGELTLRPFHRTVELEGRSPDDVIGAIGKGSTVEEVSSDDARPEQPGEFGMHLGGSWYRVRPAGGERADDPVGRLDAMALQEEVLAPVLGVDDPTTDPRLEFVPDPEGLAELERRCADGNAVAFVLHPAPIDAVMDVAEARRTMPPKSTWFQPKLPSGLFLVPDPAWDAPPH